MRFTFVIKSKTLLSNVATEVIIPRGVRLQICKLVVDCGAGLPGRSLPQVKSHTN